MSHSYMFFYQKLNSLLHIKSVSQNSSIFDTHSANNISIITKISLSEWH